MRIGPNTLYITAALLIFGCTRAPSTRLDNVALARSEAAVRMLVTGEARLCSPDHARFKLMGAEKLLVFGCVDTEKPQGRQGRHLNWGTIFDLPSMSIEMATFDSPMGGTAENQINHRLAMPMADREQRATVFRTWFASKEAARQ